MARSLIAAIILVAAWTPSSAADLTGTLKKIKDSGSIVIGHRVGARPFSYVDPATLLPTGYSIDLCLRIAEAVKQELRMAKLEVKYVPLTATNRIDMVRSGKVDIECGVTTNTLGRQKLVDFTSLTFVTGTAIIARASSKIVDLKDIEGKKLAVATGTTTQKVVVKSLKERKLKATLVPVKDHDDGMHAIETGKVDAYAADRIVLITLARQSKKRKELLVVEQALSYEPYAFMIRRNDADFRLIANRTLSRIYRKGAIVGIYDKWFFKPLGLRPSGMLKAMYIMQTLPE